MSNPVVKKRRSFKEKSMVEEEKEMSASVRSIQDCLLFRPSVYNLLKISCVNKE